MVEFRTDPRLFKVELPSMMRAAAAGLFAVTLASCAGALGPVPCRNDGECATGSFCKIETGKCEVAPACTAPGTSLCHGACLDFQTSAQSCGACDHACVAPEHGTPVCGGGQCDFTCNSGLKSGEICKQAPAAPTGLTATGGDHQIFVSWNSVADATSYELRRSAVAGGPYAVVVAGAQTAFIDGSLPEGARYFYVVAGLNAAGTGAASSEAAGVTNLPAPTALTIGALQPGRVDLSWTAVASASGYRVLRGTDGLSYSAIATPTAASYSDTSVQPGVSYFYTVQSTTAQASSVSSASAQAITPLITPPGLNAGTVGITSITLSWQATQNATGYDVYRAVGNGTATLRSASHPTTTALSYTDQVTPGVAYRYSVAAWNSLAASAISADVPVTSKVDKVTGLTVSAVTPTSASLTWTAVANTPNVTYEVFVSGDGGAIFAKAAQGLSSPSYLPAALTPGVRLVWQVRAVTADAQGPFSDPAEAVTPLLPPSNLLATSIGSTSVVLSWTTAAGVAQYEVQRSADGLATWTTLNASWPAPPYTDSGVPGKKYSYRVRSTSAVAGSASAFTNLLDATTTLAAPAGLSAQAISSSRVDLAWTASAGAAGYQLLRRTSGGGSFGAIGTTTGALSYSDTGAAQGVSYDYEVLATTPDATSASAGFATAITPLPAPALTLATASGGTISLSWVTIVNATGYNILRSSSGSYVPYATVGLTTGYADTSATPGYHFDYVIEATNAVTTSADSNSVGATLPLDVVSGLGATATATSVSLTWTATTGAAGYRVERSTDGGAHYALLGSLPYTTTNASFTDSPVSNGTAYTYHVQAATPLVTGNFSSPLTITPSFDAPANLRATGVTSTSLSLAWDAVTGAAGYELQRSPDNGVTFSTAASPAGTSYNDTGLAPGKKYVWRVRAFAGSQQGAFSQAFTSTTVLPASASFSSTGAGFASVDLAWTQVSGAAGYLIFRRPPGGSFAQLGSTPTTVNSSSYTDATVQQGTPYEYQLQPWTQDATGGASGVVAVTTPLPAPVVTLGAVTATSVTFSWPTVQNATTYNLLRNTGTGFAAYGSTTSLSYTDNTGLSAGNQYSYEVVAANTFIASAASAPVTATTPLAVPGSFAVTGTTNTSVSLSWTASANATSYIIERSTDGVTFTQAGTPSASPFTNGSLTPGVAYQYRARAANVNTQSANTAVVTGVTTLSAPAITASTPTSTQINIDWATVTGASGYAVYRRPGTTGAFTLMTNTALLFFHDLGVVQGTQYSYKVNATTSAATSVDSNIISPITPMDPPVLSAGAVSSSSVALTWTAPANAQSYIVQRQVSGGAFSQAATPTAASFTDTALSPGTQYGYTVQAVGPAGTASVASNTVTKATALNAVTLSVGTVTTSTIQLTWTTTTNATFYNLERSEDGFNTSTFLASSGTSYTDSVAQGSQHQYRVTATNSVAGAPPSNVVTATSLLPAPGGVTATATSSTRADLSWSPVNQVTGYVVQRSIDGTNFSNPVTFGSQGSPATSGTSYADLTVAAPSTYYYRVAAVNPVAQSPYSAPFAQATIPFAVPSPFSATATSTTSVQLSWGSVAGTNGYYLQRSTDNGTTYTNLTFASGTSFSDTSGLSAGGTVLYKIAGGFGAISGPYSNPVAAYLPLPTPAAPSVNTGSLFNQGIQVTWTSVAGATSYVLYRSQDFGSTFTKIGSVTGTLFNDYFVSQGPTYVYKIQAVSAYAVSALSGQSPGTALSGGQPGNPGKPTLTALSPTSVQLTWAACSGSCGGVPGIYRSTDGVNFAFVAQVSSSPYTDSGLTPATTYTYFIENVNPSNQPRSFPSPTNSITLPQLQPPTNLAVATQSSSLVTLTWTAPAGGSSTNVLYAPDGSTWNLLGTVTGTSYTDSAAKPGQLAYYSVQALAGSFTSAQSSIVKVIWPLDPPGAFTSVGASYSDIFLQWPAVNGATQYVVERQANSGAFTTVATLPATSWLDLGVASGVSYGYRVHAISDAGAVGAPNAVSTLSLKTPGPAVGVPSVGAPTVTATSISFSWGLTAGASSYRISRSFDGVSYAYLIAQSGTSFGDLNLGNGTQAWYVVQAMDASGTPGGYSAPVTAQTLPAAPVLKATGANTHVSVTWPTVPGAQAIQVERSTTAGTGYSVISTTNAGFADRAITAGTTYFYRALARGLSGNSAYSAEVSAGTGASAGIAGSRLVTWVKESGGAFVESSVVDPLVTTIALRAYLPQQGADYAVQFSTATSDGYFTVPGVPAGSSYFLRVRNSFYWTSARSFDAGFVTLGRPDVVFPSGDPTYLSLGASGLAPWQSTDFTEIYSASNGFALYGGEAGAPNPPSVGATSLPGSLVDLVPQGVGLMDIAKGDSAWFVQLSTQSFGGFPVLSLQRWAQVSWTHPDLATYALNPALSSAGTPLSSTVNFKRSAWKAYSSQINPGGANGQDYVALDPAAAAAAHGLYYNLGTPDLFIAQPPAGNTDLNFGAVGYLNPFPAWWDLVNLAATITNVSFTVPGTTTPLILQGGLQYVDLASNAASNLASGTFAPLITPPQSPLIQGVSGFQDQTGATTTPTISWSAPASGTPTFYRVQLRRMLSDGAGSTTLGASFNFFVPPSITSLTVPGGLLLPGNWYAAIITAYNEPSLNIATAPNKFTAFKAQADAITNKFTP